LHRDAGVTGHAQIRAYAAVIQPCRL
jgi:hypothetical protein